MKTFSATFTFGPIMKVFYKNDHLSKTTIFSLAKKWSS